MLSLPLPFVIAFALGLVLAREFLADREWQPSRQVFIWFVALCAAHALLIGLVWSYGFERLRPVLPVTAALLPPMARGSFRTLTRAGAAPDMTTVALGLLPAGAVLVAGLILPEAIDLLLVMIFAGYGIALWRMGRAGPDVLARASLQHSTEAYRAMRAVAVMLLLNATVDLAIIVDFGLSGGRHVESILSVISVVILMGLGGLAVMGSRHSPDEDDAPADPQQDIATNTEQDHTATLAKLDALLREGRLFTDPDLTLQRLARRAGLPARAISSAINRHHSKNVSQYVNGFRLAEACRLLLETDQSITEVQLDAGFQTKSNFNREFRREFGISPSEWRQNAQTRRSAKPEAAPKDAAKAHLRSVS